MTSSLLTLLLLMPVINLFKSLKTFSILIAYFDITHVSSNITNQFASLKSFIHFNHSGNLLSPTTKILNCLGSRPSFYLNLLHHKFLCKNQNICRRVSQHYSEPFFTFFCLSSDYIVILNSPGRL